MAEINGYLLTEEEEKECVKLIEKLREKIFTVDFTGCVHIKANTSEQAGKIFDTWVCDLQDESLARWNGVIKHFPYLEIDCIEEE